MVADEDSTLPSNGVRPAAIRRAFEVLEKLQSYNADVVPETASDDDDVEEDAPLTQSPPPERQAEGPPAYGTSRPPTPTLDIVHDTNPPSARSSPPQDAASPAPFPSERPVAAATQTPPLGSSSSTSAGADAGGSAVRPALLPASLNESSVGVSPTPPPEEDASTDIDDSRRVVIHSLTPPKVTTVVRTHSAAASSRGRFSQGIALPQQPADAHGSSALDDDGSFVDAAWPSSTDASRDDTRQRQRQQQRVQDPPPTASASERIARRVAGDVKEMRTSGQFASTETQRQLALLYHREQQPDRSVLRSQERNRPHVEGESWDPRVVATTAMAKQGQSNDLPRYAAAGGPKSSSRSTLHTVGVDASAVDFEWLLRSAHPDGFAHRPKPQSTHRAAVDAPQPQPNSHPPPIPTPRRLSDGNLLVTPNAYRTAASPRREVHASRSHTQQRTRPATPQQQRTSPRDLSPRVQQDTVSSRNRRKPPVQSLSRSPPRAASSHPPPPPAAARVAVSAYTRQLLREHNERRRQAQLARDKDHHHHQARQPSPTTAIRRRSARDASPQHSHHRSSFASPFAQSNNRSGRAAVGASSDKLPSSRRASQIHHEDPHASSSSAGTSCTWMPLPNRHATGGSAQRDLRRRATEHVTTADNDASNVRRASAPQPGCVTNDGSATPNRHTSTRWRNSGVGDHGRRDDDDLDVSPISPQQQSTISTGAIGAAARGLASSPAAAHRARDRGDRGPVGHMQPMVQYLLSLTGGAPSFVSSEVATMHPAAASPHGADVSRDMCAQWVALTTLINQPVCIEELVVPLLLSELEHRIAAVDPMATAPNDGDVAHLLCALIGLGSPARAAMDLLGEMLDNGIGDPTLVGLALRSACGEDGVKTVCTMLGESSLPQTQCAAASALGLMPRPEAGHTTIMCLGLPQLRGKKMFYQPKATTSSNGHAARTPQSSSPAGHSRHDDGKEHHHGRNNVVVSALATAAHSTGYRPTHVFLDADLVRRHLAQLTCSPLYAKRCGEASRIDHLTVLRDLVACAPFVFTRLHCEPNVHDHWASLADEMALWLAETSAGGGAPVFLPNDMESIWRDEPLLGRHVTMTLMRVLRDDATAPVVAEQVLRTIAVLPKMVTEVLADPLVEYTASLVDTFTAVLRGDRDDGRGSGGAVRDDSLRRTIAAAVLATGCVVNREVHAQKLIDSASAIAIHLLRGDDESLRRAACLALGTMGPISSNPHAVIKLLVDALSDGALQPKTACWALSRSGQHGAACLLDIASQTHLARTQRIEAALALGYIVVPHRQGSASGRWVGGAPNDASDLIAAVVKGLHRLVVDNMTLANGEQLAVAALHSLVELHKNAHRGSHIDRLGGAAAASFCNMVLDILDTNGASSARSVVLDELFAVLCRHGGPRGLHIASEHAGGTVAHGHHTATTTAVRAAAAFGLRGAAGQGYFALAAALGDASPDVRAQAVDTLAVVTVPAVLACMREALPDPAEALSDAYPHIAELLSKALHFPPPAGAAKGLKDVQMWLQAMSSPSPGAAGVAGSSSY